MQTPWSLDPNQPDQNSSSLNDPRAQGLVDLGIHAIQSGLVPASPKVKATLAKVAANRAARKTLGAAQGQPPGAVDTGLLTQPQAAWQQPSISMGNQAPAGQPVNPLDMTRLNTPNDQFGQLQGAAGIRGASENINQQADKSTNRKLVSSVNLTKSPEQAQIEMLLAQGITPKTEGYEKVLDQDGHVTGEDRSKPIYDLSQTTTDVNHPYQQQLAGLQQMEAMNRARAHSNLQRDTMDWSPLAALADSFKDTPGFQTHLAESYRPPVSGTDQVAAGLDETQKRRADLQKTLYENIKNLRGGSVLDQLAQFDQLKNTVGAGMKTPFTDPAQLMQDRNASRAYMQLVGQIKRDKPLTQMFTQYGNLNNALSNIANATHVTPQNIDEFQQAIRANLGIKGSSGVDERGRTQMNSMGLNADRIAQFLQGKPADVARDDQLVRHLQQLAAVESANIQDQSSRRLKAAAGGFKYILEDPRYANMADSLQELLGSTQAQFQPTSLVKRTQGARGGVPSSQTVRQSPVPAATPAASRSKPLEQMSQSELDAYEAALKKGGK